MIIMINKSIMDNKIILQELSELNPNNIKEFTFEGIKTFAKVASIYDADTCHIIFYLKGLGYVRINCRLNGIDTPEMKPSYNNINRENEKKAAIIARNKLLSMITKRDDIELNKKYSRKELNDYLKDNKNLVYVHINESDKYGRWLIEMYGDETNMLSFNTLLVSNGYAGAYFGGTKIPFTNYFTHI